MFLFNTLTSILKIRRKNKKDKNKKKNFNLKNCILLFILNANLVFITIQ